MEWLLVFFQFSSLGGKIQSITHITGGSTCALGAHAAGNGGVGNPGGSRDVLGSLVRASWPFRLSRNALLPVSIPAAFSLCYHLGFSVSALSLPRSWLAVMILILTPPLSCSSKCWLSASSWHSFSSLLRKNVCLSVFRPTNCSQIV